MLTIHLDEMDETEIQNFEFWVDGKRCITLSINTKNLSIQIPGGVDPESISNTQGSFFLRTRDRA